MPPTSRQRAVWERSLRSLPRFIPLLTGHAKFRRRSSRTICCQIPRGIAAAIIMVRRGPTTTPARITAGPSIAPACPMYAAFLAIAENRLRRKKPAGANAAPGSRRMRNIGEETSALSPNFLRKRIAQADRPVEHRTVRRRVLVAHEIALPLELHHVGGIGRSDRGLDPGIP